MESWILKESAEMSQRFFRIIDMLIRENILRGLQTYCNRYGIDRRNLLLIKKQPTRAMFRAVYLLPLVRDYHINAHYLMTGEGTIWQQGFTAEIVRNLQNICNKKEGAS